MHREENKKKNFFFQSGIILLLPIEILYSRLLLFRIGKKRERDFLVDRGKLKNLSISLLLLYLLVADVSEMYYFR